MDVFVPPPEMMPGAPVAAVAAPAPMFDAMTTGAPAAGEPGTGGLNEAVARKAMAIAADICVFTNGNLTVETVRA